MVLVDLDLGWRIAGTAGTVGILLARLMHFYLYLGGQFVMLKDYCCMFSIVRVVVCVVIIFVIRAACDEVCERSSYETLI